MQKSPEDEYSIRFDSGAGVLRVVHADILSPQAFSLYREALGLALEEARAITPTVCLLIDARGFEAWPTDSVDRIAELSMVLIPEDRVAVLVRSNLVKTEARRVAHSPSVQTFVSENAAWTWLMAYSVPSASAA